MVNRKRIAAGLFVFGALTAAHGQAFNLGTLTGLQTEIIGTASGPGFINPYVFRTTLTSGATWQPAGSNQVALVTQVLGIYIVSADSNLGGIGAPVGLGIATVGVAPNPTFTNVASNFDFDISPNNVNQPLYRVGYQGKAQNDRLDTPLLGSGVVQWSVGNIAQPLPADAFFGFHVQLSTGFTQWVRGDTPVDPVPEPFTMGLGALAAGAFIRKRRLAKQTA